MKELRDIREGLITLHASVGCIALSARGTERAVAELLRVVGIEVNASFSASSSFSLSNLEVSDTQSLWALNTSPSRNRSTFL